MSRDFKIFMVISAFIGFVFGWYLHSLYNLPQEELKKISILDEIRATKQLNVVLLNSPSTYYIGASGEQGFEYDLLKSYAEHLNVDLNITVANTVKEAIELSKNPNIHVTSASISKTNAREKHFYFGPSYFEVQEQLICSRNMIGTGRFPRDIEQLAGLSIIVGDETSYSETIQKLQKNGYDINATFTSEHSTEELLEMVSKNEVDCTIADSNIYLLNLRYFPEMALAFNISSREQLAWVIKKDAHNLRTDMYAWFNNFSQSGKIAQLKDHYYSNAIHFDYYNTKIFYKRIETRLPRYKKHFVLGGEQYKIPWKVLAALSYQESHWNPKAQSFTGVKGLMMLTLDTAKMLGVKNRLDPEESIMGGTRHLNQMLKFVPDTVEGENRLKFALAAYNIGMGHIQDAQILAEQMGYDKNAWSDLKKVLPLLSQKKYYKTLKFGYARGSEPIRYVEAIYEYKNILEKYLESSE
ncbi:MAG: membrane-bound lytic murein transglycosylase MltF [Sulfurimonadaceae bacterium]|jgi:membrane-bound lytic murein transglycosylase F|nr:membrane-bound lytic murein transglycosylase MltF [Sulfurimonadaceae bacterium]